jgi:hypothetical protein
MAQLRSPAIGNTVGGVQVKTMPHDFLESLLIERKRSAVQTNRLHRKIALVPARFAKPANIPNPYP